MAEVHKRGAKLTKRGGVVSIKRDHRLELDLRLDQSVLQSPELSHYYVRHRAVRIPLESFEEQLSRAGFIFLRMVAPTLDW